MNSNNHIQPHNLKQKLTFVHNGFDMNTIYYVQMKGVSIVVLIAMNSNNYIYVKQALTFVHNGLDMNTNYNVQMKWVSIHHNEWQQPHPFKT